ncbi:MAG: hypothetical protein ACFFA2_05935 [Promethearchaeota archaeon]
MVCKSKILGFTFICRDCESFYCEKCYQALIQLENACWACDKPFDTSKPSVPFKKEEDIKEEIETIKQKK